MNSPCGLFHTYILPQKCEIYNRKMLFFYHFRGIFCFAQNKKIFLLFFIQLKDVLILKFRQNKKIRAEKTRILKIFYLYYCKNIKYMLYFFNRKEKTEQGGSLCFLHNFKLCETKELVNDKLFKLAYKFIAVVIMYFNLYRL